VAVVACVELLAAAAAPGVLLAAAEPVEGRPATESVAPWSAAFVAPATASAPASETMIQAAPPMAATEPAVVTAVTA
jgi:hypothetical protein